MLDQIVAEPWYMKDQGFGPFMMGHAMTARDLFSVGAAGAYGKDDLRRVADVVRRAYRLETSHIQPGAGEADGSRRDQRGRPASGRRVSLDITAPPTVLSRNRRKSANT